MLKKCGLTRDKHCRAASVLRQGEGKLMFTDGGSSKNATSRIYSLLMEKKANVSKILASKAG